MYFTILNKPSLPHHFNISDSIKDVYVGDVDGNNYPDVLVWTTNHQLRVYKNDKGVLDVDGNLICLNINADGTIYKSMFKYKLLF